MCVLSLLRKIDKELVFRMPIGSELQTFGAATLNARLAVSVHILGTNSSRASVDLRVPPAAFKGSDESNWETWTKQHLRLLDAAFYGLLVHPKYICSREITALPKPPSSLPLRTILFPTLSLELLPFRPHWCPQRKFLTMPIGYVFTTTYRCHRASDILLKSILKITK